MMRVLSLLVGMLIGVSLLGASPARAAQDGGACGERGSLTKGAGGTLECGPKLKWRVVKEGASCIKIATKTSQLSCTSTRDGRRWIRSHSFRTQACDPSDPRLAAANITLPPAEYLEGRVAAACFALAWLDSQDLDVPDLSIIAPSNLGETTRTSLTTSARWQLSLLWNLRTDTRVTTATMFLFDSISFLCDEGEKVFSPTYFWLTSPRLGSPGYHADHPNSRYSCLNPAKTWACSDTPDIANGVERSDWKTPARAGLIQATCPAGLNDPIQVTPWKLYQGFTGCVAAVTNYCRLWSGAASYIFSLYAQELGSAAEGGGGANLDICEPGTWMSWCPQSDRLFRKYFPASKWLTAPDTGCWPGSPPYGEDGDCSPMISMIYHVRGYAFEWMTAHFGLEAAFGIINATSAAKANRALYLKILEQYTGMKPADLFAAIDTYVYARIESRIR